jgi:hypothetical protein
MGNEIKIKIGGDTTELTAATKRANEALGTFTGLTNQTGSSLRKVATESAKTAESLRKIPEAAKNLIPEGSIAEARATIKRLKDEIASLNTSQLKSSSGKFLVNELSAAKAELKSVEQQSNLTATAVGGPLTKGFGLLRTAANVLPGIGISGIIGAIGVAAFEVAQDLFKLSDAAKVAGQEMSKAFADAEGKVAGERATLQSLVAIGRNEALSKEARIEAINKLNQEYDKFLPKLTLENINTAAVTAEVNKLNEALLRQAKIKGLQDLISKETAKQAEAFTNSLEDNANTVDNIVAVLKAGITGNVSLERQIAGAERLGKNYKESEGKIKLFNKALNELLTTDAQAGTLFTEKEKTAKKEEDILKRRLEALEKVKAATKDATALVGIQESIFELQVKIAIRDQGKNQLTKKELDQQIQGFKDQLNTAFKNQAIELEAIPKVKFSDVKRTEINFEEVQSKIAKATGLDKKIVLPTQFEIDLKFNGQAFAEKAQRAREQIKAVTDSLFSGIVSGVEQGSAALGEAIGSILSGGGVGNALAKAAQGMLGIVGDVLQQVGKQIIITSGLVAALKKALQGLFGPGGEAIGFAVGAALIATGALLKSFQFDVPKLAKGGIATGPTLGIFGEAGKEAIIPLDRLPDIVGKLSMNSQADVMLAPSFRISLTDLELGLERVRNQRRRLG